MNVEPVIQPSPEPPTPQGDPTPEPSLLGETKPEIEPTEEPKVEPTPEPVVLTSEDITFPEGVTIDEPVRDEFLSILNDREKSPKEQAQALIDLQLKTAQTASEANSKAWGEMQTKWQDDVKADPVIGGDKLQPALARIGKLVSEYGSDELTSVFDLTGAGNNVHVVKFLDKIAAQLTESGPASGSPVGQDATAASRMFPSMKG